MNRVEFDSSISFQEYVYLFERKGSGFLYFCSLPCHHCTLLDMNFCKHLLIFTFDETYIHFSMFLFI